jgi:hypothetical protein
MKRAYLYLIDLVLPLPMTAAMFVLWHSRTGNAMFAAYVLTLGVLFGYIAMGLALMGVAALQYVIKDRCEQ